LRARRATSQPLSSPPSRTSNIISTQSAVCGRSCSASSPLVAGITSKPAAVSVGAEKDQRLVFKEDELHEATNSPNWSVHLASSSRAQRPVIRATEPVPPITVSAAQRRRSVHQWRRIWGAVVLILCVEVPKNVLPRTRLGARRERPMNSLPIDTTNASARPTS
jgi:hypothetical protein